MLKNTKRRRHWQSKRIAKNFPVQPCSSAALLRVGEKCGVRCANDATYLYLLFGVTQKRIAHFLVFDRPKDVVEIFFRDQLLIF